MIAMDAAIDAGLMERAGRVARGFMTTLLAGKLRLANISSEITVSSMSTVQEIERAIEKLSAEEVAEIRAWLWERDIERDASTGKFDALAEEALREHRSGKTRKL